MLFDIRNTKPEDISVVNGWNHKWKKEKFLDWWLPEENFIIEDVIFASFYKTNSYLSYMENVTSNPDCPSDIRKIALGKLGVHIFNYAKSLGFKAVIGWTDNPSVAKTSEKHGMIITPFTNAAMVKIL